MKNLKMVIFSAKSCPTCQHLKKNVLPQFKKAHPDLEIEEVVVGLNEPSSDTKAEARADAYGVQGVPAIFFEVTGLPSGGAGECNLSGLNGLLKKAQEALGAGT